MKISSMEFTDSDTNINKPIPSHIREMYRTVFNTAEGKNVLQHWYEITNFAHCSNKGESVDALNMVKYSLRAVGIIPDVKRKIK